MKRLVYLLCVFALTQVCAFAQEAQPVYRQLNAKGIEAFRAGNFPEAESLYKKALEAYTPDKTAYDQTIKRNLVLLYKRSGREAEAAEIEKSFSVAAAKPVVGSVAVTETKAHSTSPAVPEVFPLTETSTATVTRAPRPQPAKSAPAAPRASSQPSPSHEVCLLKDVPLNASDAQTLIDYCGIGARSYVGSKHPKAKIIAGSNNNAFKTGKDEVRVELNFIIQNGSALSSEKVAVKVSTKGGEIAVLGTSSIAPPRPAVRTPAPVQRAKIERPQPSPTANPFTFALGKKDKDEEKEEGKKPETSILSGFSKESETGGAAPPTEISAPAPPAAAPELPIYTQPPPTPAPQG